MVYQTDGKVFSGKLEKGQVWIKGNAERKIVAFNESVMAYQLKRDYNTGLVIVKPRSVFRRWLRTGAKLKV